jgi:hypothetical protein
MPNERSDVTTTQPTQNSIKFSCDEVGLLPYHAFKIAVAIINIMEIIPKRASIMM